MQRVTLSFTVSVVWILLATCRSFAASEVYSVEPGSTSSIPPEKVRFLIERPDVAPAVHLSFEVFEDVEFSFLHVENRFPAALSFDCTVYGKHASEGSPCGIDVVFSNRRAAVLLPQGVISVELKDIVVGDPAKSILRYPPRRTAKHVDGDGHSLFVELHSAHPYLAEYYRVIGGAAAGESPHKLEVEADTGGYASTNLWRKDSQTYLFEGHNGIWQLDLGAGAFEEAELAALDHAVYIGRFEGGGSRQWVFVEANQAPLRKLY